MTSNKKDLDHPACYEDLPTETQTALIAWISEHFEPSRKIYWHRSSYGLKHDFERDTGIYIYNGAFKGAMLKAGIIPVDDKKQNWNFKMKKKVPEGFYGWCVQRYRRKDTPLGDLARDMEMDPQFPKNATNKEEILDYLKGRYACAGAVKALVRAWGIYEGVLSKQALLKQSKH